MDENEQPQPVSEEQPKPQPEPAEDVRLVNFCPHDGTEMFPLPDLSKLKCPACGTEYTEEHLIRLSLRPESNA